MAYPLPMGSRPTPPVHNKNSCRLDSHACDPSVNHHPLFSTAYQQPCGTACAAAVATAIGAQLPPHADQWQCRLRQDHLACPVAPEPAQGRQRCGMAVAVAGRREARIILRQPDRRAATGGPAAGRRLAAVDQGRFAGWPTGPGVGDDQYLGAAPYNAVPDDR
ncbi:hypothetical protein D3C87_1473580 [compost metagenome]